MVCVLDPQIPVVFLLRLLTETYFCCPLSGPSICRHSPYLSDIFPHFEIYLYAGMHICAV